MSFLLLATLSALPAGLAQGATIPLETFLKLKEIEQVRAGSAGRVVMLTVTERDGPRGPKRRAVYIWNGREGSRRLAPELHQTWQPRWSTDAARVGFLAVHLPTADGETGSRPQLWIVEPGQAGDPVALPHLPGGVQDFAWAGEGTLIALTNPVDAAGTTGAAPAESSANIWRVPIDGRPPELLWSGDGTLSEIVASPDGGSILVVHEAGQPPAGGRREADIWLHPLDGGEPRRLTRRPGAERRPVWAPDGASLTFQAPQQPDHPNSQMELFTVSASGGSPRPLTVAFDRTILDHARAPGGRLVFRAALGIHTHLFAIGAGGAIAALTSGPFNYGAFSFLEEDSSIVAVREAAEEPQELWRIEEGEPSQLTRLNERARRWLLPRQEVIRWTAPDGLVVEGVLVYPQGYSEEQSYPLLVDPAGGPGRRARNVLTPYSLFAGKGYAVLAVNFRGSAGYGESFATARRRDLGGGQVLDVASGVDHLSRLGIANPARLGILGQGYGAEIVDPLLAEQRFRAAAVLTEDADQPFGGDRPDRTRSAAIPMLIAAEGSASSFHGFFRLLRWFDRFLKFDGADRVAFRLPGEWSPGPGGWSLRVQSEDPGSEFFTLQPGGSRYLALKAAFRHAGRDGDSDSVLELDLEDDVVLDRPDGGELPLAGTVTRFFGYPTLLLPLGTLAVTPESDAGSAAVTIDLAFPIANQAGEYLLRVAGFEPVRVWVPPVDF